MNQTKIKNTTKKSADIWIESTFLKWQVRYTYGRSLLSQPTFCSDDFAQIECKKFELCDSDPNAFSGCWELKCTALLGCQVRRQVPKQMAKVPLWHPPCFALHGVAAGTVGEHWRRACSSVLHSYCFHLIRKLFFPLFSGLCQWKTA